jgi:hypothetical protein
LRNELGDIKEMKNSAVYEKLQQLDYEGKPLK